MAKNERYILLLWGTNFDEAAAGIFVSELREAGLQVRVVGLDGSQAPGSHGLTLTSDIAVSKALQLAHKAVCIIVPSASRHWTRIQHDPRVGDLFAQIDANQGKLILGVPQDSVSTNRIAQRGAAGASPLPHPFCHENILVYPENSGLPTFIRELVRLLATY